MQHRNKFDNSWKKRKESFYNHWTSGYPQNQIQFAFKNHYRIFRDLIKMNHGKILEVGCGRGTISSFFADEGFDCYLLDYSVGAVQIAKNIFYNNKHKGKFVCGDGAKLPYRDNSFDAIISFGLLEHFESPNDIIGEQIRVAKVGAPIVNYVVPYNPNNVQKNYTFINDILKLFHFSYQEHKKPDVYISENLSDYYEEILELQLVKNIKSFGVYPLPMISHSPDFPFSLMHPWAEKLLIKIFDIILSIRDIDDPWVCDSKFGQAFFIYCEKE